MLPLILLDSKSIDLERVQKFLDFFSENKIISTKLTFLICPPYMNTNTGFLCGDPT